MEQSNRFWVCLLSVLVLIYSASVLGVVASTGDLGIRCVFGKKVKEVAPYAWLTSESSQAVGCKAFPDKSTEWSPIPPENGDSLVAIGNRRIEHYTDYVRSLREHRTWIDHPVEVRWTTADGLIERRGQVVVQRPPASAYFWSFVWAIQETVIFAIGALVYWKRPRDGSARLFFLLCVVTVGAFMGGYHWSQILVFWPLIFLFALFAVLVPVLSLHFYLVFPKENPILARHRRRVLGMLYVIPCLMLMGIWGTMSWSRWVPDGPDVETALFLLRNLALGYIGVAALLFVVCLVCLIYSYRAATSPGERNQVRWILLATLMSLLPIGWLLFDATIDPARLGMTRSAWPMFVVSFLYTVAYALSITRYKLMQAERLLNRGMVYVTVSVATGLLYSGVLVVSALLIGDRLLNKQASMGVMVACITAIVLLILSGAARQRFQSLIDRRFHREKYTFDQAMTKMSLAVGKLVDRETLGRRLLEAAGDVLRVEWGAIYLADRPGGSLVLAACCGPEPEEKTLGGGNPLLVRLREGTLRGPKSIVFAGESDPSSDALIALGGEIATPLEAEDVLAGLLILGPKRNGMPYEVEETTFLTALGSVATMALHSAEIQATFESLNHDLRDKVEKITEQQRRILFLQDQLAHQRELALPAPEDAPARPDAEPAIFGPIKGSGRAVKRMLDVARKVANSPSAVLIRGESGTGKELLAEAIHAASPRSARPFVKVHCAALSQNLLESELFGHVKGAFTGADRDRVGRFQQADGGTLFLDEIGDINLEVQTKLLRVLQQMSFEKVGSSQTLAVDVRILAATHQDLERLIEQGRFREDLYYRLNVISVRIPSLRERREDIFELAVHFLIQHSQRLGKPVTHLDEAAVEALIAYDWPGNIRELENTIERAVVLADGPSITPEDLPTEVRRPSRRRVRPQLARIPADAPRRRPRSAWGEGRPDPADTEAEAFEKNRLIDALNEAQGIKSDAAKLLDMPRSTYLSKLKKHGLI